MNSPNPTRRKLLKLAVNSTFLPVLPVAIGNAQERTGRRIILVELAGANDGLNTLVPVTDHRYTELRPNLALSLDSLVVLQGEFAVHDALAKLMPAWENGDLGFIHGLGYPHANRSHFKSMALWETGGDGKKSGADGWITHDIEHVYASRKIDAHGISLGGGMGIFSSDSGNWLAMNSVNQYRNRSVQKPEETSSSNAALAAVLEQTALLSSSLGAISKKLQRARHRSRIRGNALAEQLNHAVNLINAGIETPVLKVTLGGFDTHANQSYRHRRLLSELAQALSGARRELISSGEWNNTVILTYSEFGRRVQENKSGGTDHGTAAAHFVMGGKINGGLFGEAPDLGMLVDGDLRYTMDYRALYQEMLGSWFDINENRFHTFQDKRLANLIS